MIVPQVQTTKPFPSNLIHFNTLLSKNFWTTQKFYIKDNFTTLVLVVGLIGLAFMGLKKKKNFCAKFFLGYFLVFFSFPFLATPDHAFNNRTSLLGMLGAIEEVLPCDSVIGFPLEVGNLLLTDIAVTYVNSHSFQ